MRDNRYQRPERPAARPRAAVARRANGENHRAMMSGLGAVILAAVALLLPSGCQNTSGFGYSNEEVEQASR